MPLRTGRQPRRKNNPSYFALNIVYCPLPSRYNVIVGQYGAQPYDFIRKGGLTMDLLAGNLILIICLIAGTALIILEAFMPGFGIAGISGIVLEIIAVISAARNYGTLFALILTLIVMLLVGCAVFFSYRSAVGGRLSKSPLILKGTEDPAAKADDRPLDSWKGSEGVTVTALRPGGFIEAEGSRINAFSSGEFIPKGQKVQITGAEGDHVVVKPV